MSNSNDYLEKVKALLLGLTVGDSLGVPVEFYDREDLKRNPVIEMQGYGTHNQPEGTFSDDSSLTFCLAEALTEGFDLKTIAHNFIKWYSQGFWTARGQVFDIGNATRHAIYRLTEGVNPEQAGGRSSKDNGNGSLMRISPLLFYIKDKPINERYAITRQVSSITHGHVRSIIACFYFLEFARLLLLNKNKFEAYRELKSMIPVFLNSSSIDSEEIHLFNRLLTENIYELEEDEIYSSGYVIHTLEASIWCILRTSSYKDAVLLAVNLGDDSDTTGEVVGGLAGILYGLKSIPEEWLSKLARRNDIENLAERLGENCSKTSDSSQ